MNYKTNKAYTCKTYNDTLIIKEYTYKRYYNPNKITGAYVIFNGKREHWNDGKIYSFIENWCEITQTYEVGVQVKENPSKSDKITYVEYKVQAKSEWEARQKASELCGEQFGHNPYSTEII